MLMIVGLVLFTIISFVFYISKSTVKKQSQQNMKKLQETAIDAQPIKEFVVKCIDKLSKDAVVLIGKQGGYTYSSQGGTLVDYSATDEGLFFVKYNNFNVAYNILPPRFAAQPYFSEIPDYPWPTFPYSAPTSNSASNTQMFEGFFGINNMPPLNSSHGPNSIQEQIGAFIDKNMGKCLDFNIFEKQGMGIEMKSPKTSVSINSGSISVRSKIPLAISNQATNELTELTDFSANLDIRLGDIYFFAKELIENDIKNIKFDIGDAANNRDFVSIRVVENAKSKDDIIIVTDDKSLIYGAPFEYIFARRNRAPALHYIRRDTLSFQHNRQITQNDLLQGAELKADDPDEDRYTFKITPELPKTLNIPQIRFKVEVSDGSLSDYQIINVNRI